MPYLSRSSCCKYHINRIILNTNTSLGCIYFSHTRLNIYNDSIILDLGNKYEEYCIFTNRRQKRSYIKIFSYNQEKKILSFIILKATLRNQIDKTKTIKIKNAILSLFITDKCIRYIIYRLIREEDLLTKNLEILANNYDILLVLFFEKYNQAKISKINKEIKNLETKKNEEIKKLKNIKKEINEQIKYIKLKYFT